MPRYFDFPTATCLCCDRQYKPRHRKQKTCGSKECRRLWRKITAASGSAGKSKCVICGKVFVPKQNRQVTCKARDCQRQRKYESALELKARRADAAREGELAKLRKLRRCRLYDRSRRQEARQGQ